jgi:hypothetical protein
MTKFAENNEISRRQHLLQVFLGQVLCLSWAFVSDLSTLAYFKDLLTLDDLMARIRQLYRYEFQNTDMNCPLWQLLDKLEKARIHN